MKTTLSATLLAINTILFAIMAASFVGLVAIDFWMVALLFNNGGLAYIYLSRREDARMD